MAPEMSRAVSNEMSKVLMLLEGIELSTSPLPKLCFHPRAAVSREKAMRGVRLFAGCSWVTGASVYVCRHPAICTGPIPIMHRDA
jgi:hypothetical protein